MVFAPDQWYVPSYFYTVSLTIVVSLTAVVVKLSHSADFQALEALGACSFELQLGHGAERQSRCSETFILAK